jgi:hypothetical protein
MKIEDFEILNTKDIFNIIPKDSIIYRHSLYINFQFILQIYFIYYSNKGDVVCWRHLVIFAYCVHACDVIIELAEINNSTFNMVAVEVKIHS